MVPVHLTLLGDAASAARWIPVAKKFARRLFGAGILRKTVRSGDATIRVVNAPDAGVCKVSVEAGGGFAYQFIGCAGRMQRTFGLGAYLGITRTIPQVFATAVAVQKDGPDTLRLTARPVYSSLEEDGEDPPRWQYDPDPSLANQYLRVSPAHQPDGSGVYSHWPYRDALKRAAGTPWLLSTWAQSMPCHALGGLSAGAVASLSAADATYDYPPVLFGGLKGVYEGPETEWWRRATLCRVTTEDRSRTFIVMVDITHAFHAYPLDVREDEFIEWDRNGQFPNIKAENVQSAPCPWPDWVTVGAVGQAAMESGVTLGEMRNVLQPLWRFNHAGTRAICVAAHREDPWENARIIFSDGTMVDRQEDTPGWVEVALELEITGDGPLDFTFKVTLEAHYDARTGWAAPVDVGYLARPIGEDPADARVVLEYRHYRGKTTDGTHLVHLPTVATVASVTVNGVERKRWLAMADTHKLPQDGGYDFSPPPHTLFGGSPADVLGGQFFYVAHLVSMDLRSLSFCLVATVRELAGVTVSGVGTRFAANALLVEVTAWGVLDRRERLGHPLLKPAVEAMFDLAHPYPDLAAATPFSVAATLGYTPVVPPSPELYTAEQLATRFADLVMEDGLGGTVTEALTEASVTVLDPAVASYQGLAECGLFPDAQRVYTPAVFFKFDNFLVSRPGMVWVNAEGIQNTLDFSGYPYGALHHTAVKYLTLEPLTNTHTQFAVHPEGSWALWAGPFAANTAAVSGVTTSDVDATTYEQTVVDRVVAKMAVPGPEGTERVWTTETTHRELLNKAFDKTLTPEDFTFDLQVAGHALQIKPNSIEGDILHPWHSIWEDVALGIGFTDRYLNYVRTDLPPILLNTTWVFSLYGGGVNHDTYSPMTTFPTPRMEALWANT